MSSSELSKSALFLFTFFLVFRLFGEGSTSSPALNFHRLSHCCNCWTLPWLAKLSIHWVVAQTSLHKYSSVFLSLDSIARRVRKKGKLILRACFKWWIHSLHWCHSRFCPFDGWFCNGWTVVSKLLLIFASNMACFGNCLQINGLIKEAKKLKLEDEPVTLVSSWVTWLILGNISTSRCSRALLMAVCCFKSSGMPLWRKSCLAFFTALVSSCFFLRRKTGATSSAKISISSSMGGKFVLFFLGLFFFWILHSSSLSQ